jgi:signal transduction histidine kinase
VADVRKRLLLVLCSMSLVAVVAFALPLMGAAADERTQRFVVARAGDLDHLASQAQQAFDTGDAAALRQGAETHHRLYGEAVIVINQLREEVAAAGMAADQPDVAVVLEGALRNQPALRPERLGPWSSAPVLLSRPVGTGTTVSGAVVLRARPDAAAADIRASWRAVLGAALLLTVLGVMLSLLLARWVCRPVARLARGVRELAAGGAVAHVPPGNGPTELRELAIAFNRMSGAVAASAEQQRRLVADTSHQLRNPLAALRLRMDVLDGHVNDPGRTTYRSSVAELDRLESLLDGLLELASVEVRATERVAGTHDGTDEETCDLSVLVDEQIEVWRPVAEVAGVSLNGPELAPGTIVACSASELAQILDVLLDNAIKYAGEGAVVEVDHERAADIATMSVRDNGPGLNPDDMPRATQRFWRASGPRASRGTGLGLAIAERLAESRAGTLHLTAAPGGGLLVTVRLPLGKR